MNFCYCTGLSNLPPRIFPTGHFLKIISITRNSKPYLVSFNLITMCMLTTLATRPKSQRKTQSTTSRRKTLPTLASSQNRFAALPPAHTLTSRHENNVEMISLNSKLTNFLIRADKSPRRLRQFFSSTFFLFK